MLTTIFETNNNITTHFMPDALLTDIFATIVELENYSVPSYFFLYI